MIKKAVESQAVLAIDGDEIAYKLVRSKKRKCSMSMRIKKDGQLQINVPYRISLEAVNDFIIAKYAWIKTNQEKSLKKNKQILSYVAGGLHYYKGHQYRLCLIQASHANVMLKDQQLFVFHRKNSSIKNILDKWYKQEAYKYLNNRTLKLAEKHNFPKVQSVKIRNMSARWGSCNHLSEITYNTHLIKASHECIDYVIIHELCHLIHPNHSPRFYQLQSQLNPYWKSQKQKLNQIGNNMI